MAYPVFVQPDAILVLLQYLRQRPELTALIAADHIVTEIPSADATHPVTYPYIVIQRGGGRGIWPGLDEPSLQVDSVGGTKALCGQIARTVRACIWAIAGDVVPAGVLASGSDEMPPAYLPDTIPVPPLPRYVARYSIIIHP